MGKIIITQKQAETLKDLYGIDAELEYTIPEKHASIWKPILSNILDNEMVNVNKPPSRKHNGKRTRNVKGPLEKPFTKVSYPKTMSYKVFGEGTLLRIAAESIDKQTKLLDIKSTAILTRKYVYSFIPDTLSYEQKVRVVYSLVKQGFLSKI